MGTPGGNEQERPGFHEVPLLAVKEPALPARNEINLVSRMRFLRVVAERSVQLNHERTARKNRHREIARRWRALGQGIGQAYMDGLRGCFHTCDGDVSDQRSRAQHARKEKETQSRVPPCVRQAAHSYDITATFVPR